MTLFTYSNTGDKKKGHEDILQFDNNMYSKITSTYWSIKLYLKFNI